MEFKAPNYQGKEPINMSLSEKMMTGLFRVGIAVRSETWAVSSREGLNPTQMQIISFVASSSAPMTPSLLADKLGISRASLSDSLSALVDKKLLIKEKSGKDSRMFEVFLTELGGTVAQKLKDWPIELIKQMDVLSDKEKGQYLFLNLKVLKSLEAKGKVAPSRMCLTCVHYSVGQNNETHACSFFKEEFGNEGLRTDCAEHKSDFAKV